jgi:hypothetical protein
MTLFTIGSAIAGSFSAATQQAGAVSPEALEQARKAAVALSFYTSLSLLVGAFIGSIMGLFGGYHRDD